MPVYNIPKFKPLDEPKVGRSPWEARVRGFGQGAIEALSGLMGGENPAGQLMAPAAPLMAVETPLGPLAQKAVAALKKLPNLWHSIKDIENIASGSGPIRVYHGTTADIAHKILQEGIKLPASGEAAAQEMAARYNIPYSQWKRDIPWSGYGEETSRLSTAPYPIAARWAQHFPQGEINSQLNAQAQILSEARRLGIPYDEMYEKVYELAKKRGVTNMYDVPTAAGIPNLMRPTRPGGVVLGIDTDVRAFRPRIPQDAAWNLKAISEGELSPLDALREWNLQYRDLKVAPQNIKNIEPVMTFPRRK